MMKIAFFLLLYNSNVTFFFSNDFNIYGMMLWVFCFNTLLIDFYMVHCLSQSVCATKLGMCFSNQLELNPKRYIVLIPLLVT